MTWVWAFFNNHIYIFISPVVPGYKWYLIKSCSSINFICSKYTCHNKTVSQRSLKIQPASQALLPFETKCWQPNVVHPATRRWPSDVSQISTRCIFIVQALEGRQQMMIGQPISIWTPSPMARWPPATPTHPPPSQSGRQEDCNTMIEFTNAKFSPGDQPDILRRLTDIAKKIGNKLGIHQAFETVA